MMKYLQLKYTILFLQRNKFIGKYCFYGCWCLPARADFDHIGYGQPVDEIDHSCREFATCYNCVYNQKINGKQFRVQNSGKNTHKSGLPSRALKVPYSTRKSVMKAIKPGTVSKGWRIRRRKKLHFFVPIR